VAARNRARFLPAASPARVRARLVLGAAGLLFLALAALGPVRGFTYRAVSRKGLDLVVCLDTSRSMLAQDLRPSRLERAKREIRGLFDRLSGDRVALVAFSGDARDVAPLTRDRQTLEGLLAYVSPEDNQEGGTSLAAAIEHALSLFDGRTGAHEAIVLLTDGEDLEGQAASQAEEAAKRGIRLFVVGVGTEGGGKIPIVEQGGRSSFLKDESGQEVVTRLGRESLVALARRTGGEFLSAEESPTALEDLYRARITRLAGREIEGGERRVPYDRFQWPLALALACLLAEAALGAQRRQDEDGRAAPRLAAACLPLLAFPAQESFSFARSLANAVRHHRAGEPAAAEQAAQAILAHADELDLSEGQRARAHFALGVIAAGVAADAKEEGEAEPRRAAARQAFSAARALAGPGELRADATYDSGVLELLHAEKVRATIPEVSGQPPGGLQPGMPGPGAPAGGPPVPPPDPLPEARKLYEAARTWLVERLRLDWRDEDTRANLELVQRRLRELDAIEKQRQEQQDQQQDPNQDSQDQKDQKDQQREGKDQEDSQDQQQDQQQEQEQDDQQEKPEEEKQGEKQPEEGEPEQEEQQPQAQEGQDEQAQPTEEKPARPAERVLTREEVMQLLDKLAELEKQQKALDAALRARKRAAAKRDW
jgi:Ca-activated chloride channel family protein